MALKDVKKMCSKFCTGKSSDIVGYTPPTLHVNDNAKVYQIII